MIDEMSIVIPHEIYKKLKEIAKLNDMDVEDVIKALMCGVKLVGVPER